MVPSVSTVQATTLPAGFVQMIDDTGSITVAVPNTWTDVHTSPETSEPPPAPQILASTDSVGYFESLDVPGMLYMAYPYRADLTSLIDFFDSAADCAARATGPFDNGDFVGTYLFYSQCGDSGQSEFHVVVANPRNQAFTAIVQVQVPGPNDRPIVGTILSTFDMTSAVSATGTVPEITTVPGASSLPPTVPVGGIPASTVAGPGVATTSIG